MKKVVVPCIVMMLLLIPFSVSAEKKTVVLRVPQMICENCQAKIEKTLAFEKGVKDIACDLPSKEVTVVFDDAKTSVEALQNALTKYLDYSSELVPDKGKTEACNHHSTGKQAETSDSAKDRSCCGKK
ncbi:MAG: heavy-metal-associated domain-containing protein [Prevotellaceae bacterium]|nr:heavy-metal-associated domain-containing protein [Prevotellaceae bacterium]